MKCRHVMNFHQGAGLIKNRDRASYADVDAEDLFVLPCQTDWRGTTTCRPARPKRGARGSPCEPYLLPRRADCGGARYLPGTAAPLQRGLAESSASSTHHLILK